MIYNGKRINMYNIRATDLPHNKDIVLPKPVEIKKELEIQLQRENILIPSRNI